VLGDTIRHYEGERTFERIEAIRKLAVASRRLEDLESRRGLAAILDSLSTEEANAVVRAFSYFSLLANIAEDQHHIRRYRENRREGAPPLASTASRARSNARRICGSPALMCAGKAQCLPSRPPWFSAEICDARCA